MFSFLDFVEASSDPVMCPDLTVFAAENLYLKVLDIAIHKQIVGSSGEPNANTVAPPLIATNPCSMHAQVTYN
jgi:hypothetical protein